MSVGCDDVGWFWWLVLVKLNLFLYIIGCCVDGYYELQIVFCLLDWGDCIGLCLCEDGQVCWYGEGLVGVVEVDDLVVCVVKLLRELINVV